MMRKAASIPPHKSTLIVEVELVISGNTPVLNVLGKQQARLYHSLRELISPGLGAGVLYCGYF